MHGGTPAGVESLQRRIRGSRAARALIIAAAACEATAGAMQVAAAQVITAAIMAVTIVLMIATLSLQTALIRQLRAQEARLLREARRPDYAAIAAMEREIWGRAFEHAGAPGGYGSNSAPGRGGPG